jgi:hypothetical protein
VRWNYWDGKSFLGGGYRQGDILILNWSSIVIYGLGSRDNTLIEGPKMDGLTRVDGVDRIKANI